jgi:thiol:disulfide interchange protein DsbD
LKQLAIVLGTFLGLLLVSAQAAHSGQSRVSAPHVQVQLAPEVASVRPGEPFAVGLDFQLEKGWHVYWKNPGDSGLAPSLKWTLAQGVSAGPLEWPAPQRIALGPLVNFGYEGEVLLPSEITPPADLAVGKPLRLAARADWLVCQEDCIPGRADLELELPVSPEPPAADPDWAARFARSRAALPRAATAAELSAFRADGRLELRLARSDGSPVLAGDGDVFFFPADPQHIDNAAPQELTRARDGLTLALEPSPQRREPVQRLRGMLVAASGFAPDGAPALEVDVAVGDIAAAGSEASAAGRAPSLWLVLGFAALGGLLLNVMPCVFPVLSVKILDFVRRSSGSAAALRRHGLAYAAGVLLSFWILSGVLLALRAGGEGLGWGFQLQSPAFVVAMIFLLTALALSLLGLFDVGLGVTALAGRVPQGEGLLGSFSTGVLATAVATPCTAPFMGSALGYALTVPAATAFLVFTALGAGMAVPYVALCFAPRGLRLLPRSGPWLETFKQLMAFPLLATVVWLLWVLGLQAGVDAILGALSGLLFLSLALWLRARVVTPGRSQRARRAVQAAAVALSLIGFGIALAARGPAQGTVAEGQRDAYGIAWQRYSTGAVSALRAAGRPVFVDFTAAWCLTCKVNEHVVFSSAEIRDAFAARHVAMLRADWTSRDDEITRALESFGRSGVPLYVLWDGRDAAPQILPSVLTRGIVLDALTKLGTG